MIWDDEADRLLVRLWDEGGSLGVVAAKMKDAGYQVTRNAVAGRRHRLIPQAFKRGSPSTTTLKRVIPFKRSNTVDDKPSAPKKHIDYVAAIAAHGGIDYLDQTSNGCKAIMDGPRSGPWLLHQVCGLPRFPGTPYCRGHYKLYNAPPYPRRSHG